MDEPSTVPVRELQAGGALFPCGMSPDKAADVWLALFEARQNYDSFDLADGTHGLTADENALYNALTHRLRAAELIERVEEITSKLEPLEPQLKSREELLAEIEELKRKLEEQAYDRISDTLALELTDMQTE